MGRPTVLTICVLGALAIVANAQAAVLGETSGTIPNFRQTVDYPGGTIMELRIRDQTGLIFCADVDVANAAGATLYPLAPGELAALIPIMTDGIDLTWEFNMQREVYGSGNRNRADRLERNIFGDVSRNGVDLAGFDIWDAAFRVDSFTEQFEPDRDPHPGWQTLIGFTFLVFGEEQAVPAPAPLGPIGAGLIALAAARACRRGPTRGAAS